MTPPMSPDSSLDLTILHFWLNTSGQASFLDASDIAFGDAPPTYGVSVRGSGRGCGNETLQLKWGHFGGMVLKMLVL